MSNVPTSPLQNALAGGLGSIGSSIGMTATQALMAMGQADMMRQYNAAMSGTPFRHSPRLHSEVEVVGNGFVLTIGGERLIAKDIEELQQHFVAQVANMLLEKDQ